MSSQLPPIVPVLLKINYKVELENPEAAILQEWLDASEAHRTLLVGLGDAGNETLESIWHKLNPLAPLLEQTGPVHNGSAHAFEASESPASRDDEWRDEDIEEDLG